MVWWMEWRIGWGGRLTETRKDFEELRNVQAKGYIVKCTNAKPKVCITSSPNDRHQTPNRNNA